MKKFNSIFKLSEVQITPTVVMMILTFYSLTKSSIDYAPWFWVAAILFWPAIPIFANALDAYRKPKGTGNECDLE